MVSIAAVVARMLASVCLPVVALVVFKVRNIVGVLLAGVGLVLAGTLSWFTAGMATAGRAARRSGSGSRRMRWN